LWKVENLIRVSLAAPDEKSNAHQRDFFLSQGCLFFAGGFTALERELLG
jgi:hypothetical protein